jgi:hypothetical protein
MKSKLAKTYTFQAQIEPGPGGGAFVVFPYDTHSEFGTRGSVRVNATIDSVPYSGSLMACGGPFHMLGVLKSIRKQICKDLGDTVSIELWKDAAERTVEAPAQIHALMKQHGVLSFFESLSYTHRKEYIRWLTEAKTETTRQKRLGKAMEMLKQGVKTPG